MPDGGTPCKIGFRGSSMSKHNSESEKGFTLIELAVVVIIIGVLAGGVMMGFRVINSAEVGRIIKETHSYISSIRAFEEKYLELPGDMSDAIKHWNSDCRTTTSGDGNGQIEWGGSPNEGAAAFEHLECAGFFTDLGLSGTGANAVIGTNVPPSTTGKGGYYLDYLGSFGNFLGYGAEDGSGANDSAVLSPASGYQLDNKIDDGNASSGRVVANTAGDCHSSGDYSVTVEAIACAFRIKLAGE